ncbi:hypothetical protein EMIHUDRAFT_250583 [Emiliania huxleyi CCMP1516]|uniref:FAD-binding domain-containing protein n=2 Tax=Emiliania huxleyi TaxID=2903 RepID=A0A0D3HZ92_EMIH1|nr:hypothetical protein EMIHUDRAFT_250583 [Emiliania huxleyi CCMP1516]EOD04327.1 hypothetical protein EMIHUDRAFT_250583 [Emiliania huxleyi CCMP1516]|eukprot:XP_005756756.1 hypothetical protein EMIHUDRAFT_250583 [Emiliania huxleyi CCMP1516]
MRIGSASHQAARFGSPIRAAASHQAAAVVGAGPAGLLTAIMLAQRGWTDVSVFDARAAPPLPEDQLWGDGERSYQLGLNGRGQAALREFGAMERVSRFSATVNGRLSFNAEGKPVESRLKPPGTPGAEKTYVTRVLQRDRLQACLLAEVRERYPQVDVQFGVGCSGVDLSGERPLLELCSPPAADGVEDEAEEECDPDGRTEAFDLVVGADGVRSATLPCTFGGAGHGRDLNWGCRNGTLDLGMDALPTKEGEMVAVLLVKPSSPAYGAMEGLSSGAEARAFLSSALPPLEPYLRDDDLDRFVQRPVARLPKFMLVEGQIHASLPKGGVVLLGDAIKAGANSALEDVSVLAKCLGECGDDPAAAAASFDEARAEQARALVRTSRSFDGRGPLGTARFLVPLLLDIQLNKLLPRVFSPPMLRGLQDERNTFVGLRRTKRRERAVLLGLLAGMAAAARAVGGFVLRRSAGV